MLYTLAELSRRLNDYEDAKDGMRSYLQKNVPRITMNAARDLWIEFKEEEKVLRILKHKRAPDTTQVFEDDFEFSNL